MRSLGTLGGENSVANAINNRREVVGSSDIRNGNTRAFLWTPGHGMRNLGTLGGRNSECASISTTPPRSSARARPRRERPCLPVDPRPRDGGSGHAGRRNQSGVGHQRGRGHRRPERDRRRQVGRVPVDPGARDAESRHPARSAGLLCDSRQHPPAGRGPQLQRRQTVQPFLWMPGGGMQPLPTLGGGGGEAEDLNEFGQIVGREHQCRTATSRATLWTPRAGPLRRRDRESAADTVHLTADTMGGASGAGSNPSAHSRSSSRPRGHMAEPSSSSSPKHSRMRAALAVLGLAASLLCATPPLAAQGATGAAIEGRVLDRDSTPVEQAIVHVTNTSTGERWQTTTSARGRYFIEYLSVGGPYRIEVSAIGFAPERSRLHSSSRSASA